MTLDQIKAAIKGHCNLTSSEADTRVGETINRHHRRITAELGLDSTRFVTRTVTTTAGVRTVEFEEIEKIDRILDTTNSSSIRLLQEVSVHEQRSTQPSTGAPTTWAPQESGSSTVTALLDTIPQDTYTLQADGWAALSDLQGDDSPVFPESFHDILTWYGISEELLKKEKLQIAAAYEQKANKLLAELRHFLADSHTRDDRQGRMSISTLAGGSSGGGSGTLGATAYTQAALLTFDRGAGLAPFAVAQSDAATVTNLDADKLDGEDGLFYLNKVNHIGASDVAVGDISPVNTDKLVGRDAVGSGAAEEIGLDATLEFTGTGNVRRAALTGDITASAGSNTTALRSTTACSVIGRSANTAGAPADIAASANNTLLARIANALTWVAGVVFDGSGAVQQIAFAATQSASSDPNTLDDYEEGSWTPIIGGSGGESGQSYTLQTGTYVKIGKTVTLQFQATLSNKGTITGTVLIGNFPFVVGSGQFTALMWDATVSNFSTVLALPTVGITGAAIRVSTSVGTSSNGTIATSDIGNTTTFAGTIIYQATA